MMNSIYDQRELRVEIFEDTKATYKSNPVLINSIKYSQNNTIVYQENDIIAYPTANKSAAIDVTAERTFEAAKRLHDQYPDKRIAVLNFASATNPGGGVKKGSNAQEESLCRCSTLYPCLTTNSAYKTYYEPHKLAHNQLYSDRCIYTPSIKIIKSDEALPQPLPESEWIDVDVITCAAPNLRQKPYNHMNPGTGKPAHISNADLLKLHKKRGMRILDVALANNVDIIVLGAFGCGAFMNDASVVASAYAELMKTYKSKFTNITFAVFCTERDKQNYNIFRQKLN